MLKILPQYNTFTPDSTLPDEMIEIINSYIDSHPNEELAIDISHINIIDACYVRTLCSTTHYIKYPNNKIHWITSSGLVEEFCKDLNLGNSFSL